VQISRELDHRGRLIKALLGKGVLQMRCREFGPAEKSFREAEALAESHGYARERILAREFRGELLVARGDSIAALTVLEGALEEALALAPRSDLVTEIQRRLADAYLTLERIDEAEAAANRAIELARTLSDRTEEAAALQVHALIALHRRDEARAHELVETALTTFRAIGARYHEARAHLVFATGLLSTAPPAEWTYAAADRHLESARSLFERLDVPGHLAESLLTSCELRLATGAFEDSERLLRGAARLIDATDETSLQERMRVLAGRLDQARLVHTDPTDGLAPRVELHRLFRSGADPARAIQTLLAAACRNTASDRAFLATIASGQLKVVSSVGSSDTSLPGFVFPGAEPVAACFERGLPVLRSVATEAGEVTFALAPLCLPTDAKGFLYVDRLLGGRGRPYGSRDLEVLALLSEFATIAVLDGERREILSEREPARASRDVLARLTHPVLHRSRVMAEVLATAEKIASASASVLIRGETGSGKGLVARALHELGIRRDRPFVHVNCAALPETLLESELFGHVSGAFTGAVRRKRGLFEEAEGGTIFLDEIDKTSKAFQSKLLHVLDHREIRAVGATQPTRVNARIVSASNADLRGLILRGEFLEDLYYRLNDIALEIPPLRERQEDIPYLFQEFLSAAAAGSGKVAPGLSREATAALVRHRWPGNVRELENVARRLLVLWGDRAIIDLADLPSDVRSSVGGVGVTPPGSTLREAIECVEKQMIRSALEDLGGNKSAVARRLGVSYPTLLSKIKVYGLS
jgi:DNA-binding NtrC family response regulator/tetratricopeptide (TPR) repeat protein